MKILLLTHVFNALARRLYVEFAVAGHAMEVELEASDELTRLAVLRAEPDVIVAPILKRAIPQDVWSRIPCLVIHPGVPGDRGPSPLDWAIQEGERAWGVTVIQADAQMDAGPVWAFRHFMMRLAPKSSLYRREVADAAVRALQDALEMLARGGLPIPVAELGKGVRGRSRPLMKQSERAIDWELDDTQAVLRRIHAADGFPGVRDVVLGKNVHLYGAHEEGTLQGSVPGAVIATRDGAILRATLDGAVWITHLRAVPEGDETTLKVPAAQVLGDALANVPESPIAIDAPDTVPTWREIRYEQHDEVGVLHFAFHNGAMSTAQRERLLAAIRFAKSRPSKVLMLVGGPDYWSNGMHHDCIEAENTNAMDEVAREIATIDDRITVSALCGNAGADGVFLAFAADRVWMHNGVIFHLEDKAIGAREAVDSGLADARFGHSAKAFLGAAILRALSVARDANWPALLEAKRAQGVSRRPAEARLRLRSRQEC